MPEYTPGPWRYEVLPDGLHAIIMPFAHGNPGWVGAEVFERGDQAAANAHLMAAAPELLEALERALAGIDIVIDFISPAGTTQWEAVHCAACAAIAKARGVEVS